MSCMKLHGLYDVNGCRKLHGLQEVCEIHELHELNELHQWGNVISDSRSLVFFCL